MPTYRPIPGCPGYFAGSDGHIYSAKRWTGTAWIITDKPQRQLKEGCYKDRYKYVSICCGGRKGLRKVHTLIAEAWHGPRPDGLQVCHRDNDRFNNRPDNLRYDTRESNALEYVGVTVPEVIELRSLTTPAEIHEWAEGRGFSYDKAAKIYDGRTCAYIDVEPAPRRTNTQ